MSKFKFFENFVGKTKTMKDHFHNLSNPKVGNTLMQIQNKGIYFRVDGRSLDHLKKQNGFPMRVTLAEVMELRFTRIHEYQKFNKDPFAWGACTSLKDLEYFMRSNESHTKNAWIHAFRGSAASLSYLKIKTGIEGEGLDSENEHLVIEPVSFGEIIASTCPQYRDKFKNGQLVPNAMHYFNSALPKSLRQLDIANEKNILTWLMVNDCEVEFTKTCQSIFAGVPLPMIEYRLEGDTKLISAVQSVIDEETTTPTVSL